MANHPDDRQVSSNQLVASSITVSASVSFSTDGGRYATYGNAVHEWQTHVSYGVYGNGEGVQYLQLTEQPE